MTFDDLFMIIYLYKAVNEGLNVGLSHIPQKQGFKKFPQLYHGVLNDEIIIIMILTFFKSVKKGSYNLKCLFWLLYGVVIFLLS